MIIMNDKFLKDLENFIINFRDSNFGDLETLNKYSFEILEFKNWYNNLKKCYIGIKKEEVLSDFIKFLELFNQEKEY